MLRELRVRDYAVIEDVRLEFGPGLTVLTGETGAGKSMVVGALSMLLGERASTSRVRAGADRAIVEGRFDVGGLPGVAARCAAAGMECDDGWLIVRREVQREGRNRAWVNGSPATAGLIRSLATDLVDLHGQHEYQALLSRAAQRDILDDYAGAGVQRTAVEAAFDRLAARAAARADLEERVASIGERADFLRFQLAEIESVAPQAGEEERAEDEVRRLGHSEELLALSGEMAETLYGGEEALLDRLGEQGRRLDDLVRIDPAAEALRELHETALHSVEELGRRLATYHASVEHDPERIERLRQRLAEIDRLKRRHGLDVEAILEKADRMRSELAAQDAYDLDLAGLTREIEEARSDLARESRVLTKLRSDAARRLAADVTALVASLGMEGGVFEVDLESLAKPGRAGAEAVEFRVSLNPGFEPGPLKDVASGGELSRVMLALKTVLARIDPVPTLVFDEIDAGIGGAVARSVAARLAEVGRAHQVLAVTHLPQIAARADTHLCVAKGVPGERAEARAVAIDGERRVAEIARMLGGDPESATSRRHAEELLSVD